MFKTSKQFSSKICYRHWPAVSCCGDIRHMMWGSYQVISTRFSSTWKILEHFSSTWKIFSVFRPLTPKKCSKRYDGHHGVNFERRFLATHACDRIPPASVASSMFWRGLLLRRLPLECVFTTTAFAARQASTVDFSATRCVVSSAISGIMKPEYSTPV